MELIGHTSCRGLRRVEEQIRASGGEPRFAYRSDVNATVQAMVAAGVGAAIMPGLGVEPGDARSVAFDLSRDVPPRTLALAWHRDRHLSEPMRGFTERPWPCSPTWPSTPPAERRLRTVREA